MQLATKKLVAALQPVFVFLLLWGIASHATVALAQFPGTYTVTGDMSVPSAYHTATLLPNGKVLICGGATRINGAWTVWTTAELYDPTTRY
jgi:hypothetical protein